MQDLKPYIIPGIALLVLLLWFFVIQPRVAPSSSDVAAPVDASADASTGSTTDSH